MHIPDDLLELILNTTRIKKRAIVGLSTVCERFYSIVHDSRNCHNKYDTKFATSRNQKITNSAFLKWRPRWKLEFPGVIPYHVMYKYPSSMTRPLFGGSNKCHYKALQISKSMDETIDDMIYLRKMNSLDSFCYVIVELGLPEQVLLLFSDNISMERWASLMKTLERAEYHHIYFKFQATRFFDGLFTIPSHLSFKLRNF